MRQVILERGHSTDFGTFGVLDTGSFKCKTLERGSVGDHPCIPTGSYLVEWTVNEHPRHPECYEVRNVPGRTEILIHSANVVEQLMGCIAPGASVEMMDMAWDGGRINHLGVTSSKATLDTLINDLNKESFTLTITEE